ncbi:hypothetical protein [Actinotignum urinale]|uniref:Uncharacterized protein n=1 Tax=Actinotignum urinale TaxID=190146 RepID=A0AAW9HNX9_9ACTO|nr:hypothetical protein [Actinotignum urinale]MDY5154427.1 hypothetical protein [Actinotignum urinale]
MLGLWLVNQANQWVGLVQAFHNQRGKWLNHKTYKTQVPPNQIPLWLRPNQQWWYTHQKARGAYNLLAKQTRKATLFTFLDPTLNKQATITLPAATNELEGAINATITTTLNDLAGEPVSEFHPAQWSALIDHAIIGANQIRFIFRAGKEITVGL